MAPRHGLETVRGRVAVVTGAGSGIGRGLAERFAKEGMSVVLADIEQEALEQTSAILSEAGHQVVSVVTDVSSYDDLERLAEKAYASFGAVHLLCNNAGVVKSAPAWELTDDDWRWIVDVNLWGVVNGVRAFLPRMLAQGDKAHVVNTASVVGILPMVNKAAYAAAKAGVVAVSEALQVDLDAEGAEIGVSVLMPGFIPTRITESERNRPANLQSGAPRKSPSSIGGLEATMEADDVAGLVLDAALRGRFWVLTHKEYEPLIRERAQAVGTDAGPTAVPVW